MADQRTWGWAKKLDANGRNHGSLGDIKFAYPTPVIIGVDADPGMLVAWSVTYGTPESTYPPEPLIAARTYAEATYIGISVTVLQGAGNVRVQIVPLITPVGA